MNTQPLSLLISSSRASLVRNLGLSSVASRASVLVAASMLLALSLRGQGTYVVSFHASFDSGFGGLPSVEMIGTYTFEPLPPDYLGNGNHSAFYGSSMRSGTFALNGSSFQGTVVASLRVDDDLRLTSGRLRDAYYADYFLSGTYATNFELVAAGLGFEQVGSAPTAFTSLALPTSLADLSGFTSSDYRNATLTFRNLSTGVTYTSEAPLHGLQITLIPEPSAWALACFGLGLAACYFVRTHIKPMPNKAPAPNRRPRFPLGARLPFGFPFCAPRASPAAVGEAQRSA